MRLFELEYFRGSNPRHPKGGEVRNALRHFARKSSPDSCAVRVEVSGSLEVSRAPPGSSKRLFLTTFGSFCYYEFMKKLIIVGVILLICVLWFVPIQAGSAGTGQCEVLTYPKRLHFILGDSIEEAKSEHGLENCVYQEFKLYVL